MKVSVGPILGFMIGALEKLANAAPSSFHVLEPAKAKRLGGATMVIPSPQDVANAVALIPPGETRTILDLRRQLAADAEAALGDVHRHIHSPRAPHPPEARLALHTHTTRTSHTTHTHGLPSYFTHTHHA